MHAYHTFHVADHADNNGKSNVTPASSTANWPRPFSVSYIRLTNSSFISSNCLQGTHISYILTSTRNSYILCINSLQGTHISYLLTSTRNSYILCGIYSLLHCTLLDTIASALGYLLWLFCWSPATVTVSGLSCFVCLLTTSKWSSTTHCHSSFTFLESP